MRLSSKSIPWLYFRAIAFVSWLPLCQQTKTPGGGRDQPSLGLSLGPEFITVAQVWENQTSGPIVRLEGSKPYQIWFAETARQKKVTRFYSPP